MTSVPDRLRAMSKENQAADLLGPRGGFQLEGGPRTIAVVSFTTSSVAYDLSSVTYLGNTDIYVGAYVRLRADQDIYYFWTNNASAVVDETATGANSQLQQCDHLPAGERLEEIAPAQYLVVKGASAGKLRVCVTQSNPPEN